MLSLDNVAQKGDNSTNDKINLRNINLQLEPTDILALIGKADAGRSILLKTIKFIQHPSSGSISIDKKNLTLLRNKDLQREKRQIAYVHPKTILLSRKNILENIALPLLINNFPEDEATIAAENALIEVGLPEKATLYPRQLNALECLKIRIAQAIACKPKVLLFDELHVGSDYRSTQQINSLLSRLNKKFNMSLILATHDIETIKELCNKVAIMHHGEIIEQKSVLNFFTQPKTDIGKEFIRSSYRSEIPWYFRRRISFQLEKNTHALIRLLLPDEQPAEQLLDAMVNQFNLTIHIIQAYQESIQQQRMNTLLIIIQNSSGFNNSMQYLQEQGIYGEIIGYVPSSN